ncbi:hypothetical protein AN8383.2 [Aspergillus nidulans FGSC A4]|uniref:Non-reducing polyketide synthase ausA n=1 Tax=Emericella nidulans (strain FGSC A4 / ATCC 38163 / CBS 112.46 / NRRL 194 / M139) TaxID=227321 RepID=AUSA_EMENI|nr:protein ausA [Aspergillus nidulans FGSC A4]Q5ATJ7.1 RecName: Full=Non-reducing polyketide synthase ausA; AltName: Full=Austinoid biosynthesis clusters protein A; AltName: Full=Methylorcinaldehyde synthase ausA [Aspergillus nidulans FGSC A4]EAA67005.1 hypothetical protein AN8383.2 [Aspergillus nidulans FGSC A4]CBF80428.1 TPA: polyketide synthase, putative (JCVI) [Aspergillus nidulans FGSC A4]|eukprot:XP_681652.1 hypothetical protein AN8383.2 [Aspergillus nidulans FGSC A4]
MGSLDDNTLQQVSVLFGPKYPEVELPAGHIRRYLSNQRNANWLHDAIRDLPSVWHDILRLWPAAEKLHGDARLRQLSAFLGGGTLRPDMAEPMNFLLVPATVLRHLVDFLELKEDKNYDVCDIQGFCVGFLAAIAAACWSDNEDEFGKVVSTVLRLAVYIGAAVDLDELCEQPARSIAVRWRTAQEHKLLTEVLTRYQGAYISCVTDENAVTVTVWDSQSVSFAKELEKHGLSVKTTTLRGRFHHSNHTQAVEDILQSCERNSRLCLPSKCHKRSLPRSNINGRVCEADSLFTVAVESILTTQANWKITVTATLDNMGQSDARSIIPIGAGQFVPRHARCRMLNIVEFNKGEHINGRRKMQSATALDVGVNVTAPETTAVPIAVTGMACRYPQADSVEELWRILDLGQCTVSPMPNSRLKSGSLQREPKGPFFGNYLARPDAFDHRFFGISAREAESMDPQQRVLLQVAYEAMESAGYCGLRRSKLPDDIGCYVGVGCDDYSENVGSRNATAFSATGTLQAFNSGRISHYFGWSGPSVTVDTACSSAAVAIHLACQAIRTNDCAIAVAGGVNIMTDPRWSQNLAGASFLSPTGASKAFDADANGYCRGEGAGLLVLRPLEAALRDGDPIHAVITGTSVNQGANCSPITVPDSNSQRSLYLKALSLSGLTPDVVGYVEAHGTGTQVGDPIEFESIRKTFSGPNRATKLYVGSIKDNIGHTETSSGVAGMLKTILMIQKRRIPKQANFRRLNPRITLNERNHIEIPTQSIDWEAEKRVAMVTNYGAAGSNAAIVLREPASTPATSNSAHRETLPSHVPFYVSARTEESLRSYCEALQSTIREVAQSGTNTVQHIAYNLARKQNRDMEHFVTFPAAAGEPSELMTRLGSIASAHTQVERRSQSFHPVIICFGGQTGDTASISRNLFESCELLRFHVDECENACNALDLPSLFPAIVSPFPNKDIVNLHCVLFSIQYATAKAWLDSGLQVTRMIGHSFGQLTALCVAGGLSLIDGMRLVATRAQLIQKHWGPHTGVMLSLRASKEKVQALLDAASGHADLACLNGPDNFVVAGDEESIRRIEIIATEKGMHVELKRLKNTHAFHSRLVDAILPGLSEVANTLTFRQLDIPVEACAEQEDDWLWVTGDKIVQHSRKPVFFHDAVERTLSRVDGPCVWLEAGTASPVINMVRRVVEASRPLKSHVYLPTDLSGAQAQANLAKVTCTLWSKAVPVQFWPFHPSETGYRWINLPPYQFAKTSHWIEYNPDAFRSPPQVPDQENVQEASLVRLLRQDGKEALFTINNKDNVFRMCTAGHAVANQNLCPASLYFELVVQAALLVSSTATKPTMYHIESLNICSPLVLGMPGAVLLQLTQQDESHGQWSFVLSTRDGLQDAVTHATGRVSLQAAGSNTGICARLSSLQRLLNLASWNSIATSPSSSGLKRSTVYQAFARAVNYADYYRGVEEVYAVGHEATGRVILPSSPTKCNPCDPILIDNFIQVAGIHVNCLSETHDDEVFVCSSVGDVLIGESFVRRDTAATVPWAVYSNYEPESKKKIVCDVFVLDHTTGALAVCMLSATFTGVSIQSLKRTLNRLSNHTARPTEAEQVSINVAAEATALSSTPVAHVSSSDGDLLAVQTMLGELLGISADELSAAAALGDIGVDSLMSTEVLTEINKRFGVAISNAELTQIPDVGGLVQRIFPGHSVVRIKTHSQGAVETEITITDREPKSISVDLAPVCDTSPTAFVDKASKLFATTRTSAEFSRKTRFAGFCDTVFPQQMELVTSYVVEAFHALGADLASLTPGQVVPPVKILPQHGKVMNQLVAVLEYSDLIERRESEIIRSQQPVGTVPSLILYKKILNKHAQHASEHKLLHTTGSRLAECLSGKADPLSLLFQNAEARALMTDVYSNAPMFKSATIQLAQYLKDLLFNLGTQREIKVLEIGAGTGGTTNYLVQELAAVPGLRFQYTFTDISSSLVTLARKRFKAYDFMRYTTLDIENDPSPELQGQYDIIISTNCIHATRNLITSCTNIRRLLRPEGILCLIELTRNLFWFDLVFGLLEGWWLFNDGRSHALAHERLWDHNLRQAGFNWVDWTDNDSAESDILRLIVASSTQPFYALEGDDECEADCNTVQEQTVLYNTRDGLELFADIYYPEKTDRSGAKRPIALLIHGGGHIMLSRKEIHHEQVRMLFDMGFLPVSIDYRLCPEVSLLDGPMQDACDALAWARNKLPQLQLQRRDILPDGNNVVAVGWSTGGHLAMTLAWTAPARGVSAPEAILSFYSPTDYTDPFWSKPNFPYRVDVSTSDIQTGNPLDALQDAPISGYNPPPSKRALGGWMAPSDPRSRIALYMNWTGQTLPVLFYGCNYRARAAESGQDYEVVLPEPILSEVQKVCPFSQISAGSYRAPTFLIHGTLDDLIPVQQAQRTHDKMQACGVDSDLRIVRDGLHLFDLEANFAGNQHAFQAVVDGYEFLRRHVGL